MKRFCFFALGLLLLLALSACGGGEFVAYEDSAEALIYEQTSPFEKLDTVAFDGRAITAETLAANELNLINIWATWCGYCIQEMPGLEALSRSTEGVGFYGLLVQSDPRTGAVMAGLTEEERQVAAERIGETGVSYPQLLVSEGMLPYLADLYSFPTTWFVDAEGRPVGEPVLGAKSEEAWAEIIAQRLAMLDE